MKRVIFLVGGPNRYPLSTNSGLYASHSFADYDECDFTCSPTEHTQQHFYHHHHHHQNADEDSDDQEIDDYNGRTPMYSKISGAASDDDDDLDDLDDDYNMNGRGEQDDEDESNEHENE